MKHLHRYSVLVAAATLFLIVAGGLVTSTGSGLAVPDWPLSYGRWFPPMVGGIFFEHGHRMVAATVGFLTIVLAGWAYLAKAKRPVRRLTSVALGAVILQGVLGGLTVIFLLPPSISIAHACLGQTFLCLIWATAFLMSATWRRLGEQSRAENSGLRWLSVLLVSAVFVQLVLGAITRHIDIEAGLAIPDFPLSFGRWVPPFFTPPIAVHFAHRVWAAVVLGIVSITVFTVARTRPADSFFRRSSFLLVAMVLAQGVLGALTIWSNRSIGVATAHVTLGAAILGTSVLFAMAAFRRFSAAAVKPVWPGTLRAYIELTKPRITTMVCISALLGFFLASNEFHVTRFAFTFIATLFCASGASALNQYFERDVDALMYRTVGRPLPAGKLSPTQAWMFGGLISFAGLALFIATIHWLAALLAAITLGSYLFVYTPLKRVTPACTAVGAIPGAIPPMIGWAAATGELTAGAWLLFGILFCWQLPHFFAIAWLYRDDYERAQLPMLTVVDPSGREVSLQSLAYVSALLILALVPTWIGIQGWTYFVGALVVGCLFLAACVHLALDRSIRSARRVLRVSVAYLPLLFLFMAVDKI